jgi:hypothetical protein
MKMHTMRWVLAGLTMLLATEKAALADTTTLICHIADTFYAEELPTTIELNDTNNTATVHLSAVRIANPGGITGGGWPAATRGPMPASFSADTITFSDGTYNFTVNRLTGELDESTAQNKISFWTCQKAQKQF